MSRLIQILRSFDRKERFAVLREVLGFNPETPRLHDCFREKLSNCIGMPVPEHAFLAMDYHLDWIDMALHLVSRPDVRPKSPFPDEQFPDINQNQQDVDLLIAFEGIGTAEAATQLVHIEAKAYLDWNSAQLDGKVKRLRSIFGEDGSRWEFATPHFILMMARRSPRISTQSWPKWMKSRDTPVWLDYRLPPRFKITRCDESGRPSKNGGYLCLD